MLSPFFVLSLLFVSFVQRTILTREHTHPDRIMVLMIVKYNLSLHALLLKAQFLIDVYGAVIVRKYVKLNAMQIQIAEAILQHEPNCFRAIAFALMARRIDRNS